MFPMAMLSFRKIVLMFTRILTVIGNSTRSMNKSAMVKANDALKGRAEEMPVSETHAVTKNPLKPPFPDNTEMAMFGMGCFWGAERQFWKMKGVFSTQVGYSAGFTPNPTYNEVCTGKTGHNEVVRVVFDPAAVTYADLVRSFFDNHNPTQGNCQGNDVGTQYRSGIYTYGEDQKATAEAYKKAYQEVLHKAKKGDITTEILAAPTFYYAEDYHQQYLHKQPGGYCGLGGIPGGLRCPSGVIVGGSDKH